MSSKKYRIIKRFFQDGSSAYMPQKRELFMWFDMWNSHVKMTMDQCEKAIKDDKSNIESKRIVINK